MKVPEALVRAAAVAVFVCWTPTVHAGTPPRLPITDWAVPEGWSVPGGYDYTRATLPMSITRLAQPTGDQVGPGAFYSTQFWFKGGGGGYIGLQNIGDKRVALFSIWDTLAVSCSNAAPGAKCNPFQEDGRGFQTSIPFAFVEGRTYLLKVSYGAANFDGTWWNGDVVDQATGATSRIGSMKVPLAWGGLQAAAIQWIEWVGNAGNCEQIPQTNVWWGPPLFDNDRLGLHHRAAYPKNSVVHLENPCPARVIE